MASPQHMLSTLHIVDFRLQGTTNSPPQKATALVLYVTNKKSASVSLKFF